MGHRGALIVYIGGEYGRGDSMLRQTGSKNAKGLLWSDISMGKEVYSETPHRRGRWGEE